MDSWGTRSAPEQCESRRRGSKITATQEMVSATASRDGTSRLRGKRVVFVSHESPSVAAYLCTAVERSEQIMMCRCRCRCRCAGALDELGQLPCCRPVGSERVDELGGAKDEREAGQDVHADQVRKLQAVEQGCLSVGVVRVSRRLGGFGSREQLRGESDGRLMGF